MPEPPRYFYIPEGTKMRSPCLDRKGNYFRDATSYSYCPVDHSIYIGQALLWYFYNNDGDAAPAVGLAHEWGHNVQSRVGVPVPTNNVESITHEDQADCIAGAWIQYANEQKWIEPDDVSSIIKFVRDIASAEDDPNRDHGTLVERGKSMTMGLTGGLASCNRFYPETPIYVPSGNQPS